MKAQNQFASDGYLAGLRLTELVFGFDDKDWTTLNYAKTEEIVEHLFERCPSWLVKVCPILPLFHAQRIGFARIFCKNLYKMEYVCPTEFLRTWLLASKESITRISEKQITCLFQHACRSNDQIILDSLIPHLRLTSFEYRGKLADFLLVEDHMFIFEFFVNNGILSYRMVAGLMSEKCPLEMVKAAWTPSLTRLNFKPHKNKDPQVIEWALSSLKFFISDYEISQDFVNECSWPALTTLIAHSPMSFVSCDGLLVDLSKRKRNDLVLLICQEMKVLPLEALKSTGIFDECENYDIVTGLVARWPLLAHVLGLFPLAIEKNRLRLAEFLLREEVSSMDEIPNDSSPAIRRRAFIVNKIVCQEV